MRLSGMLCSREVRLLTTLVSALILSALPMLHPNIESNLAKDNPQPESGRSSRKYFGSTLAILLVPRIFAS